MVYEKQRERLREERRLLRILQQQAEETLANELTLALQFSSEGNPGAGGLKGHPSFKGAGSPRRLIVEKLQGPRQFPSLLCLTTQNVLDPGFCTCQGGGEPLHSPS